MDNGKIGVLALQGAFAEHVACFERLGVNAEIVKLPRDLDGVTSLVIPGGESTSIGHLMEVYGLAGPVRALARRGIPIWGTCAGMVLLAREGGIGDQPLLGLMDIGIARNAFGRQADSFEADLPVPALGEPPFRAIFIRAPLLQRLGPDVTPLAFLSPGRPVAAQQGNLLVTSFHPELTGDLRFHKYFLHLAAGARTNS